jgi:hypothetical protein
MAKLTTIKLENGGISSNIIDCALIECRVHGSFKKGHESSMGRPRGGSLKIIVGSTLAVAPLLAQVQAPGNFRQFTQISLTIRFQSVLYTISSGGGGDRGCSGFSLNPGRMLKLHRACMRLFFSVSPLLYTNFVELFFSVCGPD